MQLCLKYIYTQNVSLGYYEFNLYISIGILCQWTYYCYYTVQREICMGIIFPVISVSRAGGEWNIGNEKNEKICPYCTMLPCDN